MPRSLLRKLRNDTSGATSIEYGVMAAMIGGALLIGGDYVMTGARTYLAGQSCHWQEADKLSQNGEVERETRCVNVGGWSLRRPATH